MKTISSNKELNVELGVEITKEALAVAESKKIRSGAVSHNNRTVYGFYTNDGFYFCQDGFCYKRK
jgi:hypothetical protein